MLDAIRAATPYITLLLTVIMGLIGWICNRQSAQLESLREQRLTDERYMQERYVTQEQFYRRLGEDQKIIEQVFKELRNINATLNQMIGEDRARREEGKEYK